MFTPLRTERLTIRPVQADDAADLHARRNDPEVARWQNWELPYPRALAESIVEDTRAMGGPQPDRWWMATVVEDASGEVIGDLVLRLTNRSRTAEVGYSLTPRAWGRGFATEALGALVDWALGSHPLSRIEAGLHPDNRASAMALERTGFVFEGHTRLSFWLGEQNSDDLIYGLTRADRHAWLTRPRGEPETVRLVPVTQANKEAVLALRTHHSQEAFVAPTLRSFADALVPDVVAGAPLRPWLRALEADGLTVGMVMLAEPGPEHPEPYLWRLLVDRLHQRRGVGARALGLVARQCAAQGAGSMLVSWAEGKGSPRSFYLAHGFTPTGRAIHGETEGRLILAGNDLPGTAG